MWQNWLPPTTDERQAMQAELPQSVVNDLMNLSQAATFVGMSVPAFRLAIKRGNLPDGTFVGNTKRWSKLYLSKYIYQRFLEQQAAQANNVAAQKK